MARYHLCFPDVIFSVIQLVQNRPGIEPDPRSIRIWCKMFSFFSMNYIYSPREAFLNNYVATIWHYQFDKITWVLFKKKKNLDCQKPQYIVSASKGFAMPSHPPNPIEERNQISRLAFPHSMTIQVSVCQIAHGPGGCCKWCGPGMWLASVKSLFKHYHHNILLHHNHHNLHKVHLHKIR